MTTVLTVICALLALSATALATKLAIVKKGNREISDQLPSLVKGDTNALLTVSCRDRNTLLLANILNEQIKELRKKELTYAGGDLELKRAITNVAHDIRTPLTAICGYLDMAKGETNIEKLHDYLDIITHRAAALKTLAAELFEYSVSADASKPDEPETVDVSALLAETLISFYGGFNGKNITPQIDICEEKVKRIVDKKALVRIISNIVDNAIKYSDGDFRATLDKDGTMTFSNKAGNINKVIAEKLFDRFYTVDDNKYSTGLGLSIAKTLTKKIDGDISASFQDGTLTVTLKI